MPYFVIPYHNLNRKINPLEKRYREEKKKERYDKMVSPYRNIKLCDYRITRDSMYLFVICNIVRDCEIDFISCVVKTR